MESDIANLHRQYRREGLLPNHRAVQPTSKCRLPPLPPIEDIREPFLFSSPSYLPQLPNTISFPPPNCEKLTATPETTTFLQTVARSFASRSCSSDTPPPTPVRSRYLEEPLTTGDFDTPTNERVGNAPIPDDPTLYWPLPDTPDATLAWSTTTRRDIAAFEKAEGKEKLDVSPDVLALLQDVSTLPRQAVDGEQAFMPSVGKLWYDTVLTPPLMPCEELEGLPPLLSWEEARLVPVEAGSTEELVEALTEPFIAADKDLEDQELPVKLVGVDVDLVSSPLRKPLRAEDAKIEAPLTPPRTVTKRVRFSELLEKDAVLKGLCEKEVQGKETEFCDLTRQDALQVERELAQEQLQMADSTLRLEVPAMDFALPKPQWERGELWEELREWAGRKDVKWHGIRMLDARISYLPFSKEAAKVPKEVVDGGENTARDIMVTDQEGEEAEAKILQSLGMLGITTSDDEDEELQEAVFEVKGAPVALTFLHELAKKRKKKLPPEDTGAKRPRNTPGPRFSAASSLDNFMAIRTGKAPVPKQRPVNPPLAAKAMPRPIIAPAPTQPIPAPIILANPPPAHFIVSTALLSNLPLFRTIRALYPSATFIERDYTITHPDGAYLLSPTPLPTASPIPDADLILSPLTGLLYTNLTTLRQRPLPGAPSPFSSGETVKRTLQTLAPRYDRIVIIMHSHVDAHKSPSDVEAITSFIGFCAALSPVCAVVVRVVEGEVEEVARWVVEAMLQGRCERSLLEEETLWELWLRRAGLNAFAAQEVVRICGGLTGVVEMGVAERRDVLEGLVGKRVAARVERVLEGRWA